MRMVAATSTIPKWMNTWADILPRTCMAETFWREGKYHVKCSHTFHSTGMKAWESSYQETGVPGLIKGDMVKNGAVVIDVGKCTC